MEEQRSSARRRVLKSGNISCGGGAISCIVRNVSATGASLKIESPVGIPEMFDLLLDRASPKCRVVWRKERRIGVRFQIAS